VRVGENRAAKVAIAAALVIILAAGTNNAVGPAWVLGLALGVTIITFIVLFVIHGLDHGHMASERTGVEHITVRHDIVLFIGCAVVAALVGLWAGGVVWMLVYLLLAVVVRGEEMRRRRRRAHPPERGG
jgi:hypothetical protein